MTQKVKKTPMETTIYNKSLFGLTHPPTKFVQNKTGTHTHGVS